MKMTRMTDGYIVRVRKLLGHCFAHPWTLTTIKNTIDREDIYSVIFVEGDQVVAFLAFEKILDEGSVELIAVDENFRRRGLAKFMLEYVMNTIGELSVVTLEVRASNAPAISLYQGLGFEQIAVRKNYYADTHEDALVMQKRCEYKKANIDSLLWRGLYGKE